MKMTTIKLFCIQIMFSLCLGSFAATQGSVSIDVQLVPMGDFTVQASTLKGTVLKTGERFTAKDVKLDIKDLSSDIELRDNHMKEKYFEVAKFPTAELIDVKGSGGRFEAKLKIHGESQTVQGTFEVSGAKLIAKFKTTLSTWKISRASYMGVGVVDEVNVTITLPVQQ